MRRTYVGGGLLLVLSWLWCVPLALAEPYAGLYGGISLLANTDWKTDAVLSDSPEIDPDTGFVIAPVLDDLNLSTGVDNSAVFGGKIGYWFDFFPFVGAELEIYTFNPDININPQNPEGTTPDGQPRSLNLNEPIDFDVSVIAIGLNIMGRYPLLKSPAFPRGRIQPYGGIGPGLFITNIDDQESIEENSLGEKTLTFGGLQAVLGGKFFIIKKLSVFAEYKFTHFTADISGVSENFSFGGTQNIDAHHFYGGFAYHFY